MRMAPVCSYIGILGKTLWEELGGVAFLGRCVAGLSFEF